MTLTTAVDMGSGDADGWYAYRGGLYAGTGSFTVTATVDPDNLIAEVDESDNTITITVPVAPQGLPSKLLYPISGVPNKDWFIYNYADIDPRPSLLADYRLGGYQYDGHDAIDAGLFGFYEQDKGLPIIAVADGTLSAIVGGSNFDREVEWNNRESNVVIIDHGNGWKTLYCHLATDSSQGERRRQGG